MENDATDTVGPEPPPFGSAAHLFESVREAGENELLRPTQSLWWSGTAAGMAMSTSVVARALLEEHLPDVVWAPIVASVGYAFGFLIVSLGRMQLFTENTITTILPLLRRRDLLTVRLTLRLWGIVLAANLVGAAAVAFLIVHGGLAAPRHLQAMLALSEHGTAGGAMEHLQLGIPAGFLVAAMVWLGAASVVHRFWVVLALTWLIAMGGYAHVVAGSVEVFLLLFSQGAAGCERLLTFTAPALVGNIIGGTGLFAVLAYAQVQQELAPPEELHEPVDHADEPEDELGEGSALDSLG
ncbi:MAG: formate/nitrite transporter family protein [Myxococcota bacterium]